MKHALILILLCCPAALSAQPLFDADTALRITLTADFKTLFRDRSEAPEDVPATLTLYEATGDSTHFPIQLQVRGHYRRDRCQFPPLRVDFDADSVGGTVFEGQNKLKLVTHCQSSQQKYNDYVLLEYLVYRSYNALTDSSFRVRLLDITYRDQTGRKPPIRRMAFFIEAKSAMAGRLGGRELEQENIHPDETHRELANLMSIFQYMIGNTDWSIPGLHNVVLVATTPGMPPLPVPYDFDWSGAVNPPYAFPNPQLGIRTVRERIFRGFCRSPEEFESAFARFRAARETILARYQQQPGLDEAARKDALGFLGEFFKTIDDPKAVQRDFIEGCRK
ncbi:MAG: hypothetical protein OHK0039_43570 [Bacteroidia bacterium]